MIFSSVEKACQLLVDAAAQDDVVRTRLEQEGKLFGNQYNAEMRSLHEKNADLLDSFLAHYGWPSISKYDFKVHKAAWLIAIHAISKPHVMRRALQNLEQELKHGQPVQNEYAKLFDRVALYEGKQQYYGTQFYPSTTGFYARNLMDPENVDNRRALLGLPSFADGKKECCPESGGVMDAAELEVFEKNLLAFLKEVGWQK